MSGEKEPLNQDHLEAETYNDLNTGTKKNPQNQSGEQYETFNMVNNKVLFKQFIIVAIIFTIAYLVLAFFKGFWASFTTLIDVMILAVTFFITFSYKSLVKSKLTAQKNLYVSVLVKRFGKINHGLNDDQLKQAILDRYYYKSSSFELPNSNVWTERNTSDKTRLFKPFPEMVPLFIPPIVLTFVCLLVISWVPLRLLVLTNFLCKLMIFWFFLDVWQYCFEGHISVFLLNGHGFSAIRPDPVGRAIWVKCIIMVCFIAIGAVWSGLKLAFEAVFLIAWVVGLFGKGLVGLFSRQKKLL